MTTGPTPGRPLTDDEREVLWTAAAQHAWRGVTTAPEALFDAVERIKADAYQQGRTDPAANVEAATASMRSAVHHGPGTYSPTGWHALCARTLAALAADSTPRPVLDVAPCGCHFPKIAGCDHDEPADSTPSEDR